MIKYRKKAKGPARGHICILHSLVKAKGKEGRDRRRWAKQGKGESPAIMPTLKNLIKKELKNSVIPRTPQFKPGIFA